MASNNDNLFVTLTNGVQIPKRVLVDVNGNPIGSAANPLVISPPDGVVPAGAPFTQSSAAVLFTQDMTGYPSLSLHITANAGGNTVTYEVGNDNANWVPKVGSQSDNAGSTSDSAVNTTSGIVREFNVQERYFRARISNYVSGSTTVIPVLKSGTVAPRSVAATLLNGGNTVIGSTTLRATGTNRSTTVGTTAVQIMASNGTRQGWKVKNDSPGDIWINFDATATAAAGSGNILIPSGGYMASEPGFVETGAMSAIGSAAALAITAREH